MPEAQNQTTLPPEKTSDKEPSNDDRIDALIASYQHGMENNAPRNPAELQELKFLLGRDDVDARERAEAQQKEQQARAQAARDERQRQEEAAKASDPAKVKAVA